MALEDRFERAKKKIGILEKLLEDKSREIYLEHQDALAAKNYLLTVLDTMMSCVIVIDQNLLIETVNQATCRTLGYQATELQGQPITKIVAVEDLPEMIEEDLEHQLSVREGESTFQSKDGKCIPVFLSCSALSYDKESCEGIVLVAYDLTERKVLESQLLQAQKLESVGQLAAGVAHEINTPIQYVGDNTRFLADSFGELSPVLQAFTEFVSAYRSDSLSVEFVERAEAILAQSDLDYLREEIPAAIEQSLQGIERVSKIVSAMKELSHPGTEHMQAIDLNQMIASTITVATSEWKYVAELDTDFDQSLGLVECYPGKMSQVILNLIVNAAHAVGDLTKAGSFAKGKISIRTKNLGGFAEIQIVDTGGGIPEEIRARVFDPFFTTKEIGRGTGQGLALAHAVVVEEHLGTIAFEVEEGSGTTFVIRLPLKKNV